MQKYEHPRTWAKFLEQLSPEDARAFAAFIRAHGWTADTADEADLERLYTDWRLNRL